MSKNPYHDNAFRALEIIDRLYKESAIEYYEYQILFDMFSDLIFCAEKVTES